MRRREFITVLGAAAALPLTAHAQQQAMRVIGYVHLAKPPGNARFNDAFREGLREAGFVENQNVTIEHRWTEERYESLSSILAELVDHRVAAIYVPATRAALEAKAATQSIPVVFLVGSDPVEVGLVASISHPGGNLTGVYNLNAPIIEKLVEMLHQLAPAATMFGLLTNPENPVFNQLERRQVETAARSLGLELLVADAKDQDEIDAAFPKLIARGAHAILVGGDPVFVNGASQIAALAARYAMPTIASGNEYPKAGGLISYGYDVVAAIRLTGTYVGRILKGEKPADMPVQQMTKFEMVINLKTAKALGLTIPDKVLALADQVIE